MLYVVCYAKDYGSASGIFKTESIYIGSLHTSLNIIFILSICSKMAKCEVSLLDLSLIHI